MQPSIIQLLEISFVGVKVWPQPHDQFREQEISSFDFNDVVIGERNETYVLDNEDDPSSYGVMLRISIENKEGKIAPYDIDVCVTGHFKISKKNSERTERKFNYCKWMFYALRCNS